jgi:hypothetical protein
MKHFSRLNIKLAAVLMPVLAAILLSLSFGAPVSAASGITLNNSSVLSSFPNSLTFNIQAKSDVNITQLIVHYIVKRQNFADVTSEGWPQFTPAASVSAQWVWDMRNSSLPPGAQLQYWWTAVDAAGKTASTAAAALSFDDTRYKWQSITTSPVTIEWYNGNSSFANALMSAAQDGLKRIEDNTGAVPAGSVVIYIYASVQDLQSAQLFAQEWEGGATFTGYNIIAIAVPTNQLSYGERAVPHELTHWLVHQITFNNYGADLPTWLDEGLATYGESTTLNPDYQSALNFAVRNNQLISVRSLSSPFSAVAQQAYISYGESNSIVTFMIKTYGEEKMQQLLENFHQGSTYDAALQQVYGFDQDGLYKLWLQSLHVTLPSTTPATSPATGSPSPASTSATAVPKGNVASSVTWVLVGLVAVIILGIGFALERRSRKRK